MRLKEIKCVFKRFKLKTCPKKAEKCFTQCFIQQTLALRQELIGFRERKTEAQTFYEQITQKQLCIAHSLCCIITRQPIIYVPT